MRQILRARRIWDGVHPQVLAETDLLIEGERILELIPAREAGGNYPVTDLGDVTVIPGLIDTHMHLALDPYDPSVCYHPDQPIHAVIQRTLENALRTLQAGVTTVGDCGAPNEVIFPVREAIRSGDKPGPRIFASGVPIAPPRGHGTEFFLKTASTIDEILEAVRSQKSAGADFIKVMATSGGGEHPGESNYGAAELTALRQEAARLGLKVAAHAHGTQGIRDCIAAGIQRIEHCTFYNSEGAIEFDAASAKAIAAQGIIVSPTNVIDHRRIERGGKGAPRQELNAVWRNLLAAGVSFAASSDAGVTDMLYEDYALIPELMVNELGMTPLEALTACTSTAAQSLGQETDLGTLSAGKVADLVAVRGDPFQDISSLRDLCLVMLSGIKVPLPQRNAA